MYMDMYMYMYMCMYTILPMYPDWAVSLGLPLRLLTPCRLPDCLSIDVRVDVDVDVVVDVLEDHS